MPDVKVFWAVWITDGNQRMLVRALRGGCEPEIAADLTMEEARLAIRFLAHRMALVIDPSPRAPDGAPAPSSTWTVSG